MPPPTMAMRASRAAAGALGVALPGGGAGVGAAGADRQARGRQRRLAQEAAARARHVDQLVDRRRAGLLARREGRDSKRPAQGIEQGTPRHINLRSAQVT